MSQYKLLNKETFFEDLITQIKKAQKYIIFDAYIWANDETGQTVAKACLDAAKNGIPVIIRKDSSGVAFEHSPDSEPIFLHHHLKQPRPRYKRPFISIENFNIFSYHFFYKDKFKPAKQSKIGEKISKQKNIIIQQQGIFNHGKLILIDDTAYVGGQCISNNYRKRQDYNIKINNPKVIAEIKSRITYKKPNIFDKQTHFFDNKDLFAPNKKSIHKKIKDILTSCKDIIIIQIAYYSPKYIKIINKLAKKGIQVHIIISKKADANQDTNMLFAHKILKKKSLYLHIYLSKKMMIHTKAIATKKQITLGSTNFHNATGYQQNLNEQNIFSTDPELVNIVYNQLEKDIKNCKKINNTDQLPKRNRINALSEIIGVILLSGVIRMHKKKIHKKRIEQANFIQKLFSKEK